MPSPAFGAFLEIYSEGVVMTVSLITTMAFAERCLKRSAPLNVSGLGASVLALFYSVYGLTYWFHGLEGYDCTTLAAVNGTCMSASNALTYLHLFVKADVSNSSSVMWRRWLRWVGVATTAFNWATLVAVHALLRGEETQGVDGPRCQFVFEMTSFKLKWIAQFINQAFQVIAFVWPLVSHVKLMRGKNSPKTSRRGSVFQTLVTKALLASGISLAFTAVISGLAFTKMGDMENGTDEYIIPVFPLAALDNAVSLGAILFAVHLRAAANTSGHCGAALAGSHATARASPRREAIGNGEPEAQVSSRRSREVAPEKSDSPAAVDLARNSAFSTSSSSVLGKPSGNGAHSGRDDRSLSSSLV